MSKSNQDPVIEIRGLRKVYGSSQRPAVDGLDLSVPCGAVFGLVGGNGSGKTTTLRTVLGLCHQTAGDVRVFGEDSRRLSRAARQRVGYLSEDEFPYDDMTVPQALRFVRGFFDQWDPDWCEHLLVRLDVDRVKRLTEMSKGQRRLAELLLALAPGPELLVLDDPAIGLDPAVRRTMLGTLLEAAGERGATVLFSSHMLQDVERVVDHVGMLRDGRLVLSGELDAVKESVRRVVLPQELAPAAIDGELSRQQLGAEVAIVTGRWRDGLRDELPAVRAVERLNLEEVFLALSGAPSGTGMVEVRS